MIKKTLITAIVLIVAVFSSQAQKVDLDREYIKVRHINLPTEPILDENFRTYAVSSNRQSIAQAIKLHGFEKLAKEATVNVNVNIGGIIVDNVEIKKREKVNKDKDGNVTSVDRYYTPVITYTTNGSYKVQNSQGKPHSFGLGTNKNTHKGSEYNSYSKASAYYKNNSYNLKQKFQSEFIKNSKYQVNRKLNNLYGYKPRVDNELFWILDSKKNNDFAGHKKALADMKSMLGKIRPDTPLDELKSTLKPITDYFLSVVPKYPEDKKKHRKMKYASYYNIARLYYHFDMPDKAIEFANKLIANDYDKSDGKKIINESNRLKELFSINQLNTRHFAVETVDNSGETYSEEEAVQVAEKPKDVLTDKYLETVFVNTDGSTVEGTVKIKTLNNAEISPDLDLTKLFKNSLKLYTLDDNGEAQSKNYFARENVSFKANGRTYEAVKFNSNSDNSSQGNTVSLDGAKYLFAQVLFKGKKLSLYKYKNELVLKKADDKKGQSTKSLAYSIGFKKKLSKLVADCDELSQLAKDGSFSNTEDSLLAFVQEYNEGCKVK